MTCQPIEVAPIEVFNQSFPGWLQNCREHGRFEAFEYCLDVAVHADGETLSLKDRECTLLQKSKILMFARNQAVRKDKKRKFVSCSGSN